MKSILDGDLELRCLYLELLFAMMGSDSGYVPSDPESLSLLVGMSVDVIEQRLPILLRLGAGERNRGGIVQEGDRLFNRRVVEDMLEDRRYRARMAELGRRGGSVSPRKNPADLFVAEGKKGEEKGQAHDKRTLSSRLAGDKRTISVSSSARLAHDKRKLKRTLSSPQAPRAGEGEGEGELLVRRYESNNFLETGAREQAQARTQAQGSACSQAQAREGEREQEGEREGAHTSEPGDGSPAQVGERLRLERGGVPWEQLTKPQRSVACAQNALRGLGVPEARLPKAGLVARWLKRLGRGTSDYEPDFLDGLWEDLADNGWLANEVIAAPDDEAGRRAVERYTTGAIKRWETDPARRKADEFGRQMREAP